MMDQDRKLRQLEKQLLADIGEQLARYEFPSRPKRQTFFRALPVGWCAVHVSFIRHDTDFDATADVAVRLNVLENLVSPAESGLAWERQSASVGAELGNISQDAQLRWTVREPGDVHRTAMLIVSAIDRIGIPYIERFSDPRAVLDALSPNDRTAWLHSPFHGPRCKRIVGLTMLLDRNRLADTVDRCRRSLHEWDDPALGSFEAFVSSLIHSPAV